MLYKLSNYFFIFFCKKHYKNFFSSSYNIKEEQEKILYSILKANKYTKYLLDYNICEILDLNHKERILKEFQRNLPIINYDDMVNFIEMEKNGEKNILLSDKIELFELTSGSSSSTKYIPYTKNFLKNYMSAIYTWLYDLYKNNKFLYAGTVYWSISPLLKREKFTKGHIRVGIEDDTSYFNKISAYILNIIFTVPKEIKNIENMEDFYLLTALFLLLSKNLVMVSIWSPSFLLVLIEFIEENKEKILSILEKKELDYFIFKDKKLKNERYFYSIKKKYRKLWKYERVKELKEILLTYKKDINFSEVWKKLKLISCWADGSSNYYFLKLKEKMKNVNFQAKGLMSTECIVSFPISKIENGSIVAYKSFFYEFLELTGEKEIKKSNIKLLHEVEIGKKYLLIVTTNAGLYRYNTNDIVEIVEFYQNIAVIKFIGRNNKYSDIMGEKLENSFVEKVVEKLLKKYELNENFNLLAPSKIKSSNTKESVFYTLFLKLKNEKNVEKSQLIFLEKDLNRYLCKAYHYNYAYELKQIEEARVFIIEEENPLKIYMEEKTKKQKLGDIKYQILDKEIDWEKKFKGGYIR